MKPTTDAMVNQKSAVWHVRWQFLQSQSKVKIIAGKIWKQLIKQNKTPKEKFQTNKMNGQL